MSVINSRIVPKLVVQPGSPGSTPAGHHIGSVSRIVFRASCDVSASVSPFSPRTTRSVFSGAWLSSSAIGACSSLIGVCSVGAISVTIGISATGGSVTITSGCVGLTTGSSVGSAAGCTGSSVGSTLAVGSGVGPSSANATLTFIRVRLRIRITDKSEFKKRFLRDM